MNTNMVNVQREDHTSAHGIEASFSQTRVLPIVGKTSRAEIGLKSADIQTKCLPIFQPQVQLGTDINRLIYEVGLSATWRNSLLDIPKDGVSLPTLLYEGVLNYPSSPSSSVTILPDAESDYWNDATFQNISGAQIEMIDTYNTIIPLTLVPTQARDTALSVLFDHWNGRLFVSFLRDTCLTPVVVGSVQQKILIATTATSGTYNGLLMVGVKSTDGFKTGDRIRFFGIRNSDNIYEPVATVFATVVTTLNYDFSGNGSQFLPTLALVYSQPSVQATSFTISAGPPPDLITFTGIASTVGFVVGQQIVVSGCTDARVNQGYTIFNVGINSISCAATFSPHPVPDPRGETISITVGANYQDGYVINQTSKNGGHIEFLTDEYEFAPILLAGTDNTFNGSLTMTYDASQPPFVTNSGFFRGFNGTTATSILQSVVELTLTNFTPGPTAAAIGATYNGYYRIGGIASGGVFTLAPISKSPLALGIAYALSTYQFEMKLAPNFYTFDTRADTLIDPVITFNKMNFMRNVGFIPTDTLPIQTSTYPPTASVPVQTWTRAFTVSWDFSAYRNLKWVPQDLSASLPRQPINQQDFGTDSGSSTYYNVFEFNKFIDDCVNPAVQECINDSTYEVNNMEAYSLDGQLALAYNAYSTLFTTGNISSYVYSPSTSYLTGDLAITGITNTSLAFVATRPTQDALPTQPVNSPSWYFLGRVPYLTGDPTAFALCLKYTNVPAPAYRQITTASIEIGVVGTPYTYLNQIISNQTTTSTLFGSYSALIPVPSFVTDAPIFHYNPQTILSSVKYDGLGFGTVNINQSINSQTNVALYNYKRRSWGYQGSFHADEWLTLESNTAFKFLMDNFPSYCISYDDSLSSLRTGPKFPVVEYWVWDSTSDIDPRVVLDPIEIYQSSESLSSCMTPVQSIVVVSENIPVLEELSSPVSYLIDSDSSAFANRTSTVSLTHKIIGELFPQSTAPFTVRSIIQYEPNEIKFYALLDTRLFKQLEYSLYYRHRITQELVPLVLSNYGSVNIKFVFRPISDNN